MIAVYLRDHRYADGGWGEGCCSYGDADNARQCVSTSFQTAWALPGVMAAGFLRVFYLKYDGYDKYFPLWALARCPTSRRKPLIPKPVEDPV